MKQSAKLGQPYTIWQMYKSLSCLWNTAPRAWDGRVQAPPTIEVVQKSSTPLDGSRVAILQSFGYVVASLRTVPNFADCHAISMITIQPTQFTYFYVTSLSILVLPFFSPTRVPFFYFKQEFWVFTWDKQAQALASSGPLKACQQEIKWCSAQCNQDAVPKWEVFFRLV